VGSQELAQQLGVHVSPFGVIPKKGRANKWRLILDLSSPTDQSGNDGISKEDCSLQYASVSQVVAKVVELGRGTLMGKMDIQHAYRNIPVAHENQHFLCMRWQGKVYIGKVLPFGLRSAPLIFSAVADALQFIMGQEGVTWLVDDFLTLAPSESSTCNNNMEIMSRQDFF